MTQKENRRGFLKKSLAATAGMAAALSFEEKALLARAPNAPPAAPKSSGKGFPTGTIGSLKVSRLICGGNLISGFAHSRDLIYVSPLLKHYFTDEKVLDTLEICEERGINTAILRVDNDTIRIVNKYRNERGGKIQWIAQVKPKEKDLESDVRKCVENGALAAYVHGGVGDRWVSQEKIDLIGKALEVIRKYKVVAGLAGHAIETIKAYEKAKLGVDFYMKTLNSKSYWSAGPKERHDSVWAETPEKDAINAPGRLVVMAVPMPEAWRLALGDRPSIKTMIAEDLRVSSSHLFAGLKSSQYWLYHEARLRAQAVGADEALLLNERDELVEGATSNLWWIKGDEVFTPSQEAGCLPGVYAGHLKKLLKADGLEVREVLVGVSALDDADAVFITSSGRELASVIGMGAMNYRPLVECQLGQNIMGLLEANRDEGI